MVGLEKVGNSKCSKIPDSIVLIIRLTKLNDQSLIKPPLGLSRSLYKPLGLTSSKSEDYKLLSTATNS